MMPAGPNNSADHPAQGTLGAIVSLDWAMVVVEPTQASIKMAADMKKMVDAIRTGAPPATSHLDFPELAELAKRLFRESSLKDVFFVLNRVPDDETEAYLRQKLAKYGIEPLGIIPRNDDIARAWLRGEAITEGLLWNDLDQFVEALTIKAAYDAPIAY